MTGLLRDSIYQTIRRAILTCELMPGQELREQPLAARYRVSRSPVRDALLRLEQEGLVTVLPRHGYLVSPLSIHAVDDIFRLRGYVEPACAAAAARADDAAVRVLDRFCSFSGIETYDGANLDYNRQLHQAIADLADNSRLAAVAYTLVEEYDRMVRLSFRSYDERDITDARVQHQAIIDAIQAHDDEAAYRLSAEHVAFGRARVIAPLGSQPTPPHQVS